MYVNLQNNPERFTGYAGEPANRIWNAIYNENCFKPLNPFNPSQECIEKRVFNNLISGLKVTY